MNIFNALNDEWTGLSNDRDEGALNYFPWLGAEAVVKFDLSKVGTSQIIRDTKSRSVSWLKIVKKNLCLQDQYFIIVQENFKIYEQTSNALFLNGKKISAYLRGNSRDIK